MKPLLKMVLVLVGFVSLGPALAQPPKAPAQAPSVYDTIMQLTHEWADAEMASDVDKLNQIVADDWTAGYPGHLITTAAFLSDIRSGKGKLFDFWLGHHGREGSG